MSSLLPFQKKQECLEKSAEKSPQLSGGESAESDEPSTKRLKMTGEVEVDVSQNLTQIRQNLLAERMGARGKKRRSTQKDLGMDEEVNQENVSKTYNRANVFKLLIFFLVSLLLLAAFGLRVQVRLLQLLPQPAFRNSEAFEHSQEAVEK